MTLFRTISASVIVFSVGASIGLAFLAGCAFQPLPVVSAKSESCGPMDEIAYGLVEKFDEVPLGVGNAGGAARDFLLIGPETWTVMQVRPDKTACLIAAGRLLPPKKGRPS